MHEKRRLCVMAIITLLHDGVNMRGVDADDGLVNVNLREICHATKYGMWADV